LTYKILYSIILITLLIKGVICYVALSDDGAEEARDDFVCEKAFKDIESSAQGDGQRIK